MINVFLLIFLCLANQLVFAYPPGGSLAEDSVVYEQLGADIEEYLNRQRISIKENGNVSIQLCLDVQQRFVPVECNLDYGMHDSIIEALFRYDRETGKLSGNSVLVDSNYRYWLHTFADKELGRFWFTKVEKIRRGEEPDAAFVDYEIFPSARGGMRAFLTSAIERLKADPQTARFFQTDTMVISFVVDTEETNVPRKVRVDGIKNQTMERIIANSGVWDRGIYYGKVIPAYVEVEFYKTLYEAEKTKPIHADGRNLHFIMFPRISAAEHIQITYDNPCSRIGSGEVVVSFLLNDHRPVMYGEVILQGNRVNGERLLNLLKHHLNDSPLIKSFQPRRFYISFPADYFSRHCTEARL